MQFLPYIESCQTHEQTTPELLFEPKLPPQQLFEKFIVFNVNTGYRGRGTPNGVNLIKGNKATLTLTDKGEMNKAAQERYKLMLLQYFKEVAQQWMS